MQVKDVGGNFELRVDINRRTVHEKLIGSWDEDAFKRFDDYYRTKIVKLLGAGKWVKLTDLRQYKASTKVTPEMMANHMNYLAGTGFTGGACLVDSATLKMQLKRGTKDSVGEPEYFNNEKEADEWLKSKGF